MNANATEEILIEKIRSVIETHRKAIGESWADEADRASAHVREMVAEQGVVKTCVWISALAEQFRTEREQPSPRLALRS